MSFPEEKPKFTELVENVFWTAENGQEYIVVSLGPWREKFSFSLGTWGLKSMERNFTGERLSQEAETEYRRSYKKEIFKKAKAGMREIARIHRLKDK